MSKNLTLWDEQLAIAAAEAVSSEKDGSVMTYLSTKSGRLTLRGERLPDDCIQGVVLDFVKENAYYTSKYDATNPSGPTCFALGRGDGADMAPHENSVDVQNDECSTCPMNQFGSSDTGKGKACKNMRRLAILPLEALESGTGEVVYLRIPPTSIDNWATYVKAVAGAKHRPPFGVITEISVTPDATSQFKLEFKFVDMIEDADQIEMVMESRGACSEIIMTPYTTPVQTEAPAPRVLKGSRKRDDDDEAPVLKETARRPATTPSKRSVR